MAADIEPSNARQQSSRFMQLPFDEVGQDRGRSHVAVRYAPWHLREVVNCSQCLMIKCFEYLCCPHRWFYDERLPQEVHDPRHVNTPQAPGAECMKHKYLTEVLPLEVLLVCRQIRDESMVVLRSSAFSISGPLQNYHTLFKMPTSWMKTVRHLVVTLSSMHDESRIYSCFPMGEIPAMSPTDIKRKFPNLETLTFVIMEVVEENSSVDKFRKDHASLLEFLQSDDADSEARTILMIKPRHTRYSPRPESPPWKALADAGREITLEIQRKTEDVGLGTESLFNLYKDDRLQINV